MQSIFSSKLYLASTRKSKILAALSDPINVELVRQLEDQLIFEDTKNTDIDSDGDSDDVLDDQTAGQETEDNSESPEDEETSKNEENEEAESGEAEIESACSITSSSCSYANTDSSDCSITYSSSANTIPSDYICTSPSDYIYSSTVEAEFNLDLLKDSLNMREDTSGVARIRTEDDELWIYYTDDINLNDVMEPVIAYMNATGYTQLDFNRLARTKNAVVFLIEQTKSKLKPIQDAES